MFLYSADVVALVAGCSSNFRPSCPLSPLTDQEKATVAVLGQPRYAPLERLLQKPNAIESAHDTESSSYYLPTLIRPIARPSDGETRVGLASVPAEHVAGAGLVRAGAGVQASDVLHLPRSAIRRTPASNGSMLAVAGTGFCNAQFDMEESGALWKTHNVQVSSPFAFAGFQRVGLGTEPHL